MKNLYLPLFGLLALIGLFGCKEDQPVPQTPPSTRIFVDSINRSGPDRLLSVVRMHWSGDDKDGVVVGYELSFNNTDWAFTTRTDCILSFNLGPQTDTVDISLDSTGVDSSGTIRFNIRTQSDTTDVNFWVRAVDSDGLRDPEPAYTRIPIRNTPPVMAIDSAFFQTDTHRVVFTFGFRAYDPDGDQTLERIEIKANDGPWTSLPPNLQYLTLVPEVGNRPGVTSARLLEGATGRSLNATLSGLNLGGPNVFFMKTVDQGTLESTIDTSETVVILPRSSDWLALDLWRQNSNFLNPSGRPVNMYRPLLNEAFSGFDYLDLTDSGLILPLRVATLSQLLKAYPNVFLFTSRGDPEVTFVNSLEEGIQNFLTDGGRLLLNVPYTIGDPDPEDPFPPVTFSSLFLYSPADSVSSVFRNGAIPVDGHLRPDSRTGAGYPDLLNGSRAAGREQLITRVNPFYLKAGAEAIYRADIEQTSGDAWGGPTVAIARLRNPAGRTNIIYSSVALHEVNGNQNLGQFFRQVADEFNW